MTRMTKTVLISEISGPKDPKRWDGCLAFGLGWDGKTLLIGHLEHVDRDNSDLKVLSDVSL